MFGSTKIGGIEWRLLGLRVGGGGRLGRCPFLEICEKQPFSKNHVFFSPKTGEIYLSRIPPLSMPSVYETFQFVEKHNTKYA